MENHILPSTIFTWRIENFSKLKGRKHSSEIFVSGGYSWRVLIFPKGNNVVGQLSMYLDAADSDSLPSGWNRRAKFSLTVVNKIHKDSEQRKSDHQFNALESDWGFTSFMSLTKLHNPSEGYLVNDLCIIEAEVKVTDDKGYLVNDVRIIEAEVKVTDDIDSIFSDLDQIIDGVSSKAATTVEASYSDEDIAKAKFAFHKFLPLSFKVLLQPDQRDKFLEVIDVLSSSSDFSPHQISILKKFKSEFPLLTADFQTAENKLEEYRTWMDSTTSLADSLKKNASEYISLKSREESVKNAISELQQELKEILSKKQELGKETKTKKSDLAKFKVEASSWEEVRKKAEYTSSNIVTSWEAFIRCMI